MQRLLNKSRTKSRPFQELLSISQWKAIPVSACKIARLGSVRVEACLIADRLARASIAAYPWTSTSPDG
jgi:hypothetical protein